MVRTSKFFGSNGYSYHISLSIHATKPSISIASEKARLLHRQLEQASASIQNGFSGSLLFIIPDIKLAKIAVGDGLRRIDYNHALLKTAKNGNSKIPSSELLVLLWIFLPFLHIFILLKIRGPFLSSFSSEF